ncbi:MAG: alpha/beta fold hydrolase [Deltaproteobacteria bacterium]|nr:MAG: alpha/beta fold hydrolase [Deltaproteobacteria bacterium]
MATVEASDGVKLYAEVHGRGLPVLLSCGYCQTHENFRGQVEPLRAAGCRVVLWDYRGHGKSEAPHDPLAYSMERVVDDMRAVLAWAAPGERAVVGGLSFGGLASLHYALAHPRDVCGLLLFDSGPGFKKAEAQARWEAQVERIATRLERDGWDAFLAGRGADTAVGSDRERPAARTAARAIAAQDPRAIACFGRRVAGPAQSVIDALPDLEVPALILVGEHDEAYLRAADVMGAKLPDATRVTIPDAGHVSNIEQPDAFNAALIGFLDRLR